MLYALMTAAKRGVEVILITPERSDSILTRYASRSYLKELVSAGVKVALYKGGMLHCVFYSNRLWSTVNTAYSEPLIWIRAVIVLTSS